LYYYFDKKRSAVPRLRFFFSRSLRRVAFKNTRKNTKRVQNFPCFDFSCLK